MSQGNEVKVFKKSIVPRNRPLEGTGNYRFSLRIKVKEDSILLVSIGSEFHRVRREDYLDRVGKILLAQNYIQELDRIAKELNQRQKKVTSTFRSQIHSNGIPIIPGSSLKGLSRSRLEYMFIPKQVGASFISYSCYAIQEYDYRLSKRHKEFWGQRNLQLRERCNVKSKKVCVLCDIYGAAGQYGRVDFSDAVFEEESVEQYSSNQLGRIKAIKPGSSGSFTVTAKNFTLAEAGLMLASFGLHRKGSFTILGFYKYRYNPRVGTKAPYNDYYFGLVNFELESVEASDGVDWKQVDQRHFESDAIRELEHSEYGKNMDFQVGWL